MVPGPVYSGHYIYRHASGPSIQVVFMSGFILYIVVNANTDRIYNNINLENNCLEKSYIIL